MIRVHQGRADIFYVRGQGEGQYGELHQGHDQDHQAHTRVPKHLQELLDQHLPNSQNHGSPVQFQPHFTVGEDHHDCGINGEQQGVETQYFKADAFEKNPPKQGDENSGPAR